MLSAWLLTSILAQESVLFKIAVPAPDRLVLHNGRSILQKGVPVYDEFNSRGPAPV
jgi:hypothetical protein